MALTEPPSEPDVLRAIRGQLTVYLRLNDIPLPSLYGPTADEPM